MIKLTELYRKYIILENQELDFKNNEGLVSFIKKFLKELDNNPNAKPEKGPDGWDTEISSAIYNTLRNDDKKSPGNASKLMAFSNDEISSYKKYFNSPPFNSDGIWSQYDINNQNRVKKDGKTYNVYFTLDKNKDNILNFFKKYYLLAKDLTEFSKNNNNIAISFKTTPTLDVVVTENDNLKVYYYDKSYGDSIEKVVRNWASSNNITFSKRAYTKGIDKDGSSFGMLISNKLSEILVDTIKKYKNKYTPQQYADWLDKHAPKLLSNIKFD